MPKVYDTRCLRNAVVMAVLLAGCTAAPSVEVSVTAPPTQASQAPASPSMRATPTPTLTPAAGPSTAPIAEPSPQPPPQSPPPITVSQENLQAPEAAAARAFVEAIDAQDYAAAWELLGPRSRETLGSQEALEEQGSALSEGWGAWARSPDALIFRSGLLTDIDEEHKHSWYVVTFTGTVTQEGTTEQRTVAAPAWVEHEDGGPVRAWFEPFAEEAPPLEIVDPVEAGTMACDDVRIAANVPAERGGTAITLDGEPEYPDFENEPGHVVFPLDGPLSAGEHVLTFAFISYTQGMRGPLPLYADAVRFTVEGPC